MRHERRDRFASPVGNARNSITILQIRVLNVRVDIRKYDVISINSGIFALKASAVYRWTTVPASGYGTDAYREWIHRGAVLQIDDVRRENGALGRWKNMI